MQKYNLKDQTMSESDLQKIYNYKIYPRDSKITTNKGFVNIDNGSQGGTHWTCFYIKNKKSYYFDSVLEVAPGKFLLKQLPKPIIYHNFKIQNINSQCYVAHIVYIFFYLIEQNELL